MGVDPERSERREEIGRRGLLTAGGALALSPFLARAPAAAADFPPNPLEEGWILDRHDEFNGSLDSGMWVTNYLGSRTTEERAAARFGFRDNALVLRIEDDQPTYYADGNPMKVSSIQTGQMTGLHKDEPWDHDIPTEWKYTPKYGYFEIRARTSARSGLHAAFWTVGTEESERQNAEIDIMEDPGTNPNEFMFNLHRWSDPNVDESNNTIRTGFDITEEMHIYALEWSESQISLYVDNEVVKTVDSSPSYNMAFLLGIYENAGWTGDVDPHDPRPKEFVVDYFRAYKPA